MLTMLNRMCWNTAGWRYPSGSTDESGYPGENGFGHEEWNFNLEDNVDGFVYAYVYYRPPHTTIQRARGEYRIGFWTRDPASRNNLLVGIYNIATLPSQQDYNRADEVFAEKRIYSRRADELNKAVPRMSRDRAFYEVTCAIRDQLLPFRCHIDDVQILKEPILLENLSISKGMSYRFATPVFIKDDELPNF